MIELLSVAQMDRADHLAIESGTLGERLMEAAGFAVALEAMRRFAPCRVVVLCGPGNNGGDGFVAARHLARRGYLVQVGLLGELASLKGDAALMAGRWRGAVSPLSLDLLDRADLVIDALFGAGLSRPLDGVALALIDAINLRRLPVIAVDVPSGLDGDSGAVLGAAADCLATVTFFRAKPGHALLTGRAKCGTVVVADIGIPETVLADIAPQTMLNAPDLWLADLPRPAVDGHKYARGHALVLGGDSLTGAARLAARAARRIGAGLVTIAAPAQSLGVYRAGDPGTIVIDEAEDVLADPRRNAILAGPGGGGGEAMRERVAGVLAGGRKTVLDADALTAFAGRAEELWGMLRQNVVLTPHDGEFARLFGDIAGSRLQRACAAARLSGAVVLLKGPDTVIAHPDGRAAITVNAPAWLATAGSGDVLAGMIVGLFAQGMEPWKAAAAAAWLHGEAASGFGPGLIAEDIAEGLPAVLAGILRDGAA